MGGDKPGEAKVPNPYLAAIKAARASSTQPAHTLETAFDKAGTAMSAGAWTGGTADSFFSELSGYKSTAKTAASNSLQEFDDAIGDQPAMVDPNSWQVHWHNL